MLGLSKSASLRRWLEHSPTLRPLTSRFVAGLHLKDALQAASTLRSAGIFATLDRLGENVSTTTEARAACDAYLNALDHIAEQRLDATVSVKLTALGLDVSESACLQNATNVVARAQQIGSRVEFDMESSAYTDRTLQIVRQLQVTHPGCVRAVIQAYLRRSPSDVRDLSALKIPVRLCKGAYQEPPSLAYATKAEVDQQYRLLVQELLLNGTYPAIATHDDRIIAEVLAQACSQQLAAERFEFQMLYGVRRDLQKKIVESGYRLRVYVPYGEAWYPYFMRRLAERPANVWFLLKSLGKE